MDASGESMLTLRNAFHSLIRVTAILTMIVGNLMAIRQTQLKRLFAYSSIAHTGYILTGFLAGFYDGYSAVVFYLLIYSIIALGVFTIFTWLSEKADGGLTVEKLTGLSTNHPGLAFGLTFFFISLAGLPPTGGFIAKYFIFYSAAQAGEIPLVIVAVITSIFGLSYYLRLTASLYLPPKSSTVSLPLTGLRSVP
jgi:NADH-quinone oxidoreductase subunit N